MAPCGTHAAAARSGSTRSIRRQPSGVELGAPGIRIEGLRKRYGEGDTAVDALKDVNMVVAPGEVVIRQGESGDRFYAVADGTFDISDRRGHVRNAGRGSFFG